MGYYQSHEIYEEVLKQGRLVDADAKSSDIGGKQMLKSNSEKFCKWILTTFYFTIAAINLSNCWAKKLF